MAERIAWASGVSEAAVELDDAQCSVGFPEHQTCVKHAAIRCSGLRKRLQDGPENLVGDPVKQVVRGQGRQGSMLPFPLCSVRCRLRRYACGPGRGGSTAKCSPSVIARTESSSPGTNSSTRISAPAWPSTPLAKHRRRGGAGLGPWSGRRRRPFRPRGRRLSPPGARSGSRCTGARSRGRRRPLPQVSGYRPSASTPCEGLRGLDAGRPRPMGRRPGCRPWSGGRLRPRRGAPRVR